MFPLGVTKPTGTSYNFEKKYEELHPMVVSENNSSSSLKAKMLRIAVKIYGKTTDWKHALIPYLSLLSEMQFCGHEILNAYARCMLP